MSEFMGDRRRGLEDAFFAEQDAVLRRRLSEADTARTQKDVFRAASGIHDEAVLDRLKGMGIGADTLTALSLVPCVVVAWADGGIDAKERAAALQAAEQAGVTTGTPAFQMFESWLNKKPGPDLLAAWKGYVAALLPTLDDAARQALRTGLLERARAVASASGGFMGVGRTVSGAEQTVMQDLEQALAAG